VGTPCWMAPEVISQNHYDSKADIWSLGITALELAQGRAPRSRDPPYKVLMRTVQEEPPTLDRGGGQFKYSKAFKEVIESCLMKDPSKRPTAGELLQTPFFKSSKKKSYLVGALLTGLPPLVDRQERRRVPSALTHLSMESWDFTQSGVSSPSTSVRLNGIPDEGLFEMEGVKTSDSPEEDRRVAFIAPLASSVHDIERRTEEDDSPPGDSTDDASTPATTPPSSSPVNPIAIPRSHLSKPVPMPPESSPIMSVNAASPPASPGLWRKLRGKGSKAPLDNEKGQHDTIAKPAKGALAWAFEEKRRGVGSILHRSTSRTGSTILSRSPR